MTEMTNLYEKRPDKVKFLQERLDKIKSRVDERNKRTKQGQLEEFCWKIFSAYLYSKYIHNSLIWKKNCTTKIEGSQNSNSWIFLKAKTLDWEKSELKKYIIGSSEINFNFLLKAERKKWTYFKAWNSAWFFFQFGKSRGGVIMSFSFILSSHKNHNVWEKKQNCLGLSYIKFSAKKTIFK